MMTLVFVNPLMLHVTHAAKRLASVERSILAPLRCAASFVAGLLAFATAGAQAVRVELRDSSSSAPLSGVLVTALDSTGQRRADGLSGESGVVTLRLPAAGTWTITVRRIGVRPRAIPGVRVADGGTQVVSVTLASVQQVLPPIRVTADGRSCGREPDADTRVGRLWEQITLALRAATISQRDKNALPPLLVTERRNELSATLEERNSVVTRQTAGSGRLVAADDPEALATLGYVRAEADDSRAYFAPDEVVLLSDSFLATHCFSTPKKDANSLLAELRFKPVRGRKVADVEGTAFVDVNTGELRHITYSYVASRKLIPVFAEHAGGEVQVRRLANGQWIVNKWFIRMPIFGQSATSQRLVVTGYHEVAGLVQDMRQPARASAPRPPR